MSKVWRIKEKQAEDEIEQLLLNRGIKTPGEREDFFNPRFENYVKDLEISGIEKSLKRIEKAISTQELIVVFGDYDVDGVTASAILYKALTSIGAKVLPYIPHREREGYGLSKLGLEFARDSGASVVITVDNGIVAFEAAEFAKTLGLDLIITDHHTTQDKKPEAFSIVHSVKMCGAAVAWTLVRNVIKKELGVELLQFVAIATIADMMPLLGINRSLVIDGLKQLNKTKNLGLLSLFTESRIEKGEIKSYEIGHIISPRINAIGRLEHAIDALRLICTSDPVKAKRLAKLLTDTNIRRQDLTAKAYEEALVFVQTKIKRKINVLYSKDWHPGIIGLIAGRITEQFSKPTLAISVGKELSKGSARSIKGLNITEVLRSCKDILIDVGGHSAAAGFSLRSEHIEIFTKKVEEVMMKTEIEEAGEFLDIEVVLPQSRITKSLCRKIDEFEPFGLNNPKPVFATLNSKLSDIRTVGSGKHLKFKADGIDAIAFNMGDLEPYMQTGNLVNVAYNLEINKFNGNETLQLKVKDIELST